jgi:hypothetical protein
MANTMRIRANGTLLVIECDCKKYVHQVDITEPTKPEYESYLAKQADIPEPKPEPKKETGVEPEAKPQKRKSALDEFFG